MVYVNATQVFLGDASQSGNARIELNDVQGLWGGRNISVAGSRRAIVQRVQPGLIERRYEFELDAATWTRLLEVLVATDFLTIRPAERPGIPDEPRPCVTIVNAQGERRSVAKWAGVEDVRFDGVYRTLLQLASLTEMLEPVHVEPYRGSINPDMPSDPFAVMRALRRFLRGRAQERTPDAARLEKLLAAAASLEAVHTWAAQMQLGAEGFDNTASARAYADIQEHLNDAAREIEKACLILCRRDSTY
jgi:hypothetical protein